MKLMTLNTHSLLETQGEEKLRCLADFLLRERPEVIALQEVNQRMEAPPAERNRLSGFTPVQEAIPVRRGNYALELAALLREGGAEVSWTYLPVKCSWGRFDEGLALLAMGAGIAQAARCCISRSTDYEDWRTRGALAVRLEERPDWFCCVHMGWWEDAAEPFLPQWRTLQRFLVPRRREGVVWLMGDFNAPANLRGQSYDCIAASGWHDAWTESGRTEGGETICAGIDGWEEMQHGARIDQIWCSDPGWVADCRVVLSEQPVSDHCGVLVTTRE